MTASTVLTSAKVGILSQRSQFTFKIKEVVEKRGFRADTLRINDLPRFLESDPGALMLSGGDQSVYDEGAILPPREIFSHRRQDGSLLPVFGICFGMQTMAHLLGGKVESGTPEYGPVNLKIVRPETALFSDMPTEQKVFSNHGDRVTQVPPGFCAYAYSSGDILAAMGNGVHEAVQFHPEVTHTPYGEQMLCNFLEKVAGCQRDYAEVVESLSASIESQILETVGNGIIILPWSAGVDSATVAAHIPAELKDRTILLTVDGGNQQIGDREHQLAIADHLSLPLRFLDCHDELERTLSDTIDAEVKRARFTQVYVRNLVTGALTIAQKYPSLPIFVLDGTNNADTIESGGRDGKKMKSHHNKSIDWSLYGMQLVTPLEHLFKHQVRNLARYRGLPENVCQRRPFPGPGQLLRIVGTPATQKLMRLAAELGYEAMEILKGTEHEERIAQMPAGYWALRTVGNEGENRVYENTAIAAFRPVHSLDFMTAEPYYLPRDVEEKIGAMARSKPGINRAVFDYNPKPPATIEWE